MPVPAPFSFFWPLSGDVTQAWATWARMVGQWGLININVGGDSTPDPVLERRIVDEVASYGRQLGRISEALEALIEATVTEEAADGQRLEPQQAEARRADRGPARVPGYAAADRGGEDEGVSSSRPLLLKLPGCLRQPRAPRVPALPRLA
jgi:hypothetical protein